MCMHASVPGKGVLPSGQPVPVSLLRAWLLLGVLMAFLVPGLLSCGQGSSALPVPASTFTVNLTASPTSIQPGQESTLSWLASGASTLSIDNGVGPVTGSSIKVQPTTTTTYTLTATSGPAALTAQATVTVVPPVQPSGLTYGANPAQYTAGKAIPANQPSSTGGTVASYAVSPALPAGLMLDPATGILTGTPTAVAPEATYTITATNAAGSTTVAVVLTVGTPPNGLSYGLNPAVYAVGTAIPPDAPQCGGGPVTVYTVSPPLPAGLSLAPLSGIITGTPTAAVPETIYTVSASNASGSATAPLTLTVNASVLPLTGLTYSTDPASYQVGVTIVPNLPKFSGTAPTVYRNSPALPPGLILDATTGAISGTPAVASGITAYAITATNGAGSATYNLAITVAPGTGPTFSLNYALNPATYAVGMPIAPNLPVTTGGSATSYSVTPALPAGLGLDTSTGTISGTPTVPTPMAGYLVTATGPMGYATVGVTITVNAGGNAGVIPPFGLTYTLGTATYTQGVAITPNSPTSSGGAVASYSVSPALPSGLTFSPTTGVIGGNPTAVSPSASYTVTASNAAGSTTLSLGITVDPAVIPPAGLNFAVNPSVYAVGVAITPNPPSTSGGVAASYAVSPDLPNGLTLDQATGILSGTPTTSTATTVYTITAMNSAGRATVGLTLTVLAAVVPPMALSYPANPVAYGMGRAVAPNLPSCSGGAVASYSVQPDLPDGLSMDQATGIISGTPTTPAAPSVYTVVATNSAGTASVSLNLTVNANEVPPGSLAYRVNPALYTAGMAMPPNPPSCRGGAVTTYSVSPALPTGLSLNTLTGIISGTPTIVTNTMIYTITATNPAGSVSVGLRIGIQAVATPVTVTSFVANLMFDTYSILGNNISQDNISSFNYQSNVGLGWTTQNGVSAILSPGPGQVPAAGDILVQPPLADTTYSLTVTGGDGSTIVQPLPLTYVSLPSAPQNVLGQIAETVAGAFAPVITSFTASKLTFSEGDSVVLSWVDSMADSASIMPGVGQVATNAGPPPNSPVPYTVTVTPPPQTTTYTLIVSNSTWPQTVSQSLTLTYVP